MPSNYPQHCGRNRHAVAMASRLRRGVVVVVMPILAVAAYGCSGPGRAGLSGVEIDAGQGTLTLVTGCYDRVVAAVRHHRHVRRGLSLRRRALRGPVCAGRHRHCGGVHGEDGAFCEGHPERVLLAASDGRWDTTGFEAELFCPDPAETFGAPDLPAWVCDP